jgi:hypothetical protein
VLDSKGPEAEKRSDEIYVEVLSKTVLLGWKGTIMYKGEPMPYSRENAIKLLKLKDFRNRVIEVAGEFEHFKLVKDSEDEKN